MWSRNRESADLVQEEKSLEKRGVRAHRVLDYYAGIPLVFLLGSLKFKYRKHLPKHIQCIGMMCLGAIGDTVLLTAVVSDVRAAYPEAHIALVISGANQSLVPLLTNIDEFIILDITKPLTSIRKLQSVHFDVLADFTQWPRISALYTALGGARFTLGFSIKNQHRASGFDLAVEHSPTRHELENFRALAAAFGVQGSRRPSVQVPEAAIKAINCGISHPFVVLHPWASGYMGWLREWPIDRYIELARIIRDMGYQVVVTGSSDDVKKAAPLLELSKQASVEIISFVGQLSLTETAALLTQARLVVAVSTGILHLAAALDVPLVALYGPTNSQLWGPVSENAITLTPRGVRSGYLYLGFEYPKRPINCMQFIATEDAIAAVRLALCTRHERSHNGNGGYYHGIGISTVL